MLAGHTTVIDNRLKVLNYMGKVRGVKDEPCKIYTCKDKHRLEDPYEPGIREAHPALQNPLNGQEHSMAQPPYGEIPRRAVPYATEEHDDHQIQIGTQPA